MADDIELNIGINAKYLEDSINKVLERIEKSDGIKVSSPSKTLPKSPFATYAKEKTQVEKVHLDPLEDKKKKEDPKLNMKNYFDALKKWSRVFKIDLYWRWLKGMFFSITKYMPLLGKFGEIITAALTLIFTALLLPFLPGILEALKWLLDKSVAFFNYMKGLEGLSPSVMAEKITADMNKFFTETPWGEYGKTVGTKINNAITLVDDLINKVEWKTIGESIGGFINGVVETLDGINIGKTIAAGIDSALTFIDAILDSTKWNEIGSLIGETFATAILNIDWLKIGDIFGSVIIGIIELLIGVLEGLVKGGLGKGHEMRGPTKVSYTAEEQTKMDKEYAEYLKTHPTVKAASGGIFTQPTNALIGEAGPEMVIPLDKMGSMGGTSITVNGLVDEHKFRSIIREEIDKSNRRLFNARGAVSI